MSCFVTIVFGEVQGISLGFYILQAAGMPYKKEGLERRVRYKSFLTTGAFSANHIITLSLTL